MSTSDLWTRFLRHLPLWVVMLVTTWLMRATVAHFHPLIQLFICAPFGLLVGLAVVCLSPVQRKVAMRMLDTVRELKKNP